MYKGSNIQREEFVRLVLQSLRDVGYLWVIPCLLTRFLAASGYQTLMMQFFRQSAAVLEAESGYVFESDMVSQFRQSVLQGQWDAVEQVLEDMGVHGDGQLRVCASFRGHLPCSSLSTLLIDII
jgi:hypothetical protein